MTHTTARLIYVAHESWNNVNVQVEHRLPGRRADIDANIVAVGAVTLVDDGFCRIYHRQKGRLLRFSRIKQTRHMSSRNNERVSRRYWIPIPQRDHELILRKNTVFRRVAEWTGFCSMSGGHDLILFEDL